jgi:hypothetical protein
MIPFSFVQISDGTTTCTLRDSAAQGYSYIVEDYAPRIPARNKSVLGGRGPMLECVEQMTVIVVGDSAANAVDNLYRLWGLLDQAYRWTRNERVSPVKLRLQSTQCGRKSIVECLVLGQTGDDAPMDLAPEENVTLRKWIISGIQIRFVRRGQWLAPIVPSTDTIINVGANGYVITTNFNTTRFSAQQTSDPLQIQVTLPVPSSVTINNIAVLLADSTATTGGIERFDAADISSTAPFSNVLDTAHFCASLDYVLRYTPTSTTAVQTQNLSQNISSQVRFAQRIAIYATVRNNSAVASYDISVQAITVPNSGIQTMATTTPVTIPAYSGSAKPIAVCLGVMAGSGDATTSTNSFEILRLTMQASAVDQSLDIDQIYVVALDTPGGADILIPSQAALNLGANTLLTVDPCQLTRPRPHVRLSSVIDDSWRFLGGAGVTTWTVAAAPSMACVILMPTGANWRYVVSGAAVTLSVTLTRQLAYATPQ